MSEFATLLRRHNYRVTTPRRHVFAVLHRATEPLPLSEVVRRCPEVDRASVYRAIDVCLTIDAVKIVHAGWKKRYEVSELFRPHHHHFHCIICQRLIAVAYDELESSIATIARKHHFTPLAHQFEVEGLCQCCQSRKAL